MSAHYYALRFLGAGWVDVSRDLTRPGLSQWL